MTRTPTHAALCYGLALLLAGCGGGDDGSIGGTVSGLAANTSVGLQNNGQDSLTVTSNGGFQFPTLLQAGDPYAVTVVTEPVGQTCTVTGGSGLVDTSDDSVDNVSVVCTALLTLSGTVSGLAPGTSVTLSDGAALLPIAANGAFEFPGTVALGTSYVVGIATQPVGETCAISAASGTVTAAGVPPIIVTCS